MLKLGTIFVFNVSNGSNKACLIRTVRVFFFVGVQNEGPTHLKGIVDERLQREVSMFKYKTYLGMILESSEFSNEYNICIYKEDGPMTSHSVIYHREKLTNPRDLVIKKVHYITSTY